MAQYLVQVNGANAATQKTVVEAGGKAPVQVQATAGGKIQLVDPQTGLAPKNLKMKKVGQDLHISMEGGEAADLIVEGYYTPTGGEVAQVIGEGSSGQFYQYMADASAPVGGSALANIAGAPVGQFATTAAVGGGISGAIGALGSLGGTTLLGAAAAAALIAAAGKDDKDTTPPAVSITLLGDADITADEATDNDGIVAVTGETGSVTTITFTNDDGDTVTKTITNNGSAQVVALTEDDLEDLGDGEITISASTTDTNGNTTTTAAAATTTFDLDFDAPNDPGEGSLDLSESDSLTYDEELGLLSNDATPEFGGETEPEAIVTLTITDGEGEVVATYTTQADETGAWSITPEDDLPEGTLTPEITITDAAGNPADDEYTGEDFTVDSTAPADATGGLTAGDTDNDTGSSDEDGITNQALPELSGTAEENAAVSVVIEDEDGMAVATLTTTADEDGDWSIQVSEGEDFNGLSDGDYTPVITLTDAAGNSSETDGTTFTIDTDGPMEPTGGLSETATNDTGASTSDGITNQTVPTLSGTAEANATVSVVLVQDDDEGGGATVATLTTTADDAGAWSVALGEDAALEDGDYTPYITATDVAGNEGEEYEGDTFTVDTEADYAENGGLSEGNGEDEDAATDSDTGADSNDGITRNATSPNFSGDGLEENSTVTVVITHLQEAQGVTTAQDIDTPPMMDEWVAVATLTATVDVNGAWSVDYDGEVLVDGQYRPLITVVDAAGNIPEDGNEFYGEEFIIDTVVEADTKTYLTDRVYDEENSPSHVTEGNVVHLSVYTTNPISHQQKLAGTPLTAVVNEAGEWSIPFSTDDLATGYYFIELQVFESEEALANEEQPIAQIPSLLGNMYSSEGELFILEGDAKIILNTYSDYGVSNTDGITSDFDPDFSGSVEAGSTVKLLIKDEDGNTVVEIEENLDEDDTRWDFYDSDYGDQLEDGYFTDGTYTTEVTVTDVAGNVDSYDGQSFTVDTEEPDNLTNGGLDEDSVTATITEEIPAMGEDAATSNVIEITNSATPTFSGTGAEPGGQVGVAITTASGSESYQQILTTVGADGKWELTVPEYYNLEDGRYYAEIITRDVAGNAADERFRSEDFIVDTTAILAESMTGGFTADPDNDTGADDRDRITSNSKPAFNGTTEAGATVTVSIYEAGTDGEAVATLTATADAEGAWSVTATEELEDGDYTPYITAIDRAGNEMEADAGLTGEEFTIDTTKPATPTVNAQITTDSEPEITGSATVGEDETLMVTVAGSNDGEDFTATYEVSVDEETGEWELELDDDTRVEGDAIPGDGLAGFYTVTATVVDTAGNTSVAAEAELAIADFADSSYNDGDEDTEITGDVDGDEGETSVDRYSIDGVDGVFEIDEATIIPGIGSITIAADGSYTFTPALNWSGEVPRISFVTSNGAVHSHDLDVDPVSDTPIALIGDTVTVSQVTGFNPTGLTTSTRVAAETLQERLGGEAIWAEVFEQLELDAEDYTGGDIRSMVINLTQEAQANIAVPWSFHSAETLQNDIAVMVVESPDGSVNAYKLADSESFADATDDFSIDENGPVSTWRETGTADAFTADGPGQYRVSFVILNAGDAAGASQLEISTLQIPLVLDIPALVGLADTDGSEYLDDIMISGLPEGWTFANGGGGEVGEAGETAGTWLFDSDDLVDGLQLVIPFDSEETSVDLTLTAVGEDTFEMASDALTHVFTVNIVGVQLSEAAGTANNDIAAGGAGDDALGGTAGTAGSDSLAGLAGDDTINGGAGDDALDGGEGDDSINGGADNDLIIGGAGDDTLTGGAGSDTFAWPDGEDFIMQRTPFGEDTPIITEYDTITDFELGVDGDIIDLSQVLNNPYLFNIDNYIQYRISGEDSILEISFNGNLNFDESYHSDEPMSPPMNYIDLEITLEGVDIAGDAIHPVDVLNKMMSDGNLFLTTNSGFYWN